MSLPVQPTLIVLQGKTGSGKTAILHHLSSSGYAVIDIEAIAQHRGSVFGSIGMNTPQPPQHVFEQKLAEIYQRFSGESFVFTEFEAGSIGKRKIPGWFYQKMEEGLQVVLQVSKKQRTTNIIHSYFAGKIDDVDFLNAVDKLSHRLPEKKIALLKEMISAKNYTSFVDDILNYYDQSAQYNNSNPPFIEILAGENFNVKMISNQVIRSLHQKGIALIS